MKVDYKANKKLLNLTQSQFSAVVLKLSCIFTFLTERIRNQIYPQYIKWPIKITNHSIIVYK